MTMKRVNINDIAKSKGRTKKETLDKLSDAQIAEAVLSDTDSVIPTEEELKEFKPVSGKEEDHD